MAKCNSLIEYCDGPQEFLDRVTDDLIVLSADYEEEEELADVVKALDDACDKLVYVIERMKKGLKL